MSFIHVSSEGGHIGRFHWRNSIGSFRVELYDEAGRLCQLDVTTLPGEFGFLGTQFDLDAWQMTAWDQYIPDLFRSFASHVPQSIQSISRILLKQETPSESLQEDPELAAFRARLEGRYPG